MTTSQVFGLKPNALRLLFDTYSVAHNVYNITDLENPIAVSSREQLTTLPGIVDSDLIDYTWGNQIHPDNKGGLFYATNQPKSIIPIKFFKGLLNRVSIAISDTVTTDSIGRYDTISLVEIWGAQHNDRFSLEGINVNESAIKDAQEPVTLDTTNAERAILLAHRCYQQISETNGVQKEANLDWVKSMSDKEATERFNNDFKNLTL